jgi:hypothetical protein
VTLVPVEVTSVNVTPVTVTPAQSAAPESK